MLEKNKQNPEYGTKKKGFAAIAGENRNLKQNTFALAPTHPFPHTNEYKKNCDEV